MEMWSKIIQEIQSREEIILRISRVLLPIPILWIFFDITYFIRTILLRSRCLLSCSRDPPDPFVELIYGGICLTTDLDFMFHMNNARYLRTCDFARYHYWAHSHIYKALQKWKSFSVVKATNIRYRRSIQFLQRFNTHTKLVYWDQRNFYLEQRMIRTSDKFICAVIYSAHTVLSTTDCTPTPQEVLDSLYGHVECPHPSAELAAWIHSTELSSKALRKE